jgi:hypothetical protein
VLRLALAVVPVMIPRARRDSCIPLFSSFASMLSHPLSLSVGALSPQPTTFASTVNSPMRCPRCLPHLPSAMPPRLHLPPSGRAAADPYSVCRQTRPPKTWNPKLDTLTALFHHAPRPPRSAPLHPLSPRYGPAHDTYSSDLAWGVVRHDKSPSVLFFYFNSF